MGVLSLAMLAGCSTSRQEWPLQQEALRPHAGAYIAEQHRVAPPRTETWRIGTDEVGVNLLLPEGGGPFPLLIYLPGLGESVDAGVAWRRTWVQAGYAVLAIQPAAFGAAAWQSEAARAGDFHGVAKQAFSAPRLAARVAVLRGVLDELRRRMEKGAYAEIDSRRCAVVGYDLGAQAAMAVAGQRSEGIAPPPFPIPLKGVIALSPYADFGGSSNAAAFDAIRVPVLSVTALEDTDSYAMVTSAAVRRAPFQHMPPGNKFLLVLSAANHALLAGGEVPSPGADSGMPQRGTEPSAQTGRSSRRGGAGGNARRSHGGDQGSGRPAPFSAPNAAGEQTHNVQSMSTAFLDAVVKDDPVAWEWLKRDARRWFGDSAQLMTK